MKNQGIRYGVINQREVLQAWADSSEAFYSPYCPYPVYDVKTDKLIEV